MAQADISAAHVVPHWSGRPLPQPGQSILLTALVQVPGSHFLSTRSVSGVVDKAELNPHAPTSELIITLVGDPEVYLLRSRVPLGQCRWTPLPSGWRDEPVVAITGEPAATVSADEPAAATPANSADYAIVALERRLLEVQRRLVAIKSEEKTLGEEARRLSDEIIDEMLVTGMETPPGVEGMTAYVSKVYYVEYPEDPDTGQRATPQEIAEALRKAGYGALVTEGYHGGQLRALIREITDEGVKPLPDALEGKLRLGSRPEVRFTPQAQRKRATKPRKGD